MVKVHLPYIFLIFTLVLPQKKLHIGFESRVADYVPNYNPFLYKKEN